MKEVIKDTKIKPAEVKVRNLCPECGEPTVQQKCKVICRSGKCIYRIIYNCSEF